MRSPLRRPRPVLLLALIWLGLVVTGAFLAFAAHTARLPPGDLSLARELQEPRPLGVVLTPLMTLVSLPGYFP